MNSQRSAVRKLDPESGGADGRVGPEPSPDAREEAGIPRFLLGRAAQAKLEVGAEDDPLEREADAAAEAVVHDEPSLPRFLAPGADRSAAADPPASAREPSHSQSQPSVRRKSLRADPPDDGRGGASTEGGEGGDRVQPLLPSLRPRLEATLGADLGQLRVHQGPTAANANARLGARAFTLGSDVWLGERQRPDDVGLIAHEAAHVVQQGRGDTAIRRRTDAALAAPASTSAAAPAGQSFGFSEDEMASRLAATPAEGAEASATSVFIILSNCSSESCRFISVTPTLVVR